MLKYKAITGTETATAKDLVPVPAPPSRQRKGRVSRHGPRPDTSFELRRGDGRRFGASGL